MNEPTEALQRENQALKKDLDTRKKELESYKAEVERLQELLRKFKDSRFGKKSEKIEDLDELQLTFNEIESESKEKPSSIKRETITYTRSKGRRKRKPFPEHLKREVVKIDLPENEKVCPHHGEPMNEMGFQVSEKLVVKPAEMWVREEHYLKYVCTRCESPPVQAKVESVLPGTIATPELLSFVIFSKFFQALPLYRQEELFSLFEVPLSRGTMARWLIQLSEKLIPIWNVLQERVLESGYMCIDATGVQVLKEKGRKPEAKSFMWCRGSPELGIVLFDYNVSGAGYVAKSLTEGFEGGLQSDAHGSYNLLSGLPQI